jgi:hypothetical protein
VCEAAKVNSRTAESQRTRRRRKRINYEVPHYVTNFLHPPVTSALLGSNILRTALLSNTLNYILPLNVVVEYLALLLCTREVPD